MTVPYAQVDAVNLDLHDTAASAWLYSTPLNRAVRVLNWAYLHEIETSSIVAGELAAAMNERTHWASLPSDYLEMIYCIVAFLKARI